MSEPIRIRRAAPADAEAIASFNEAMARETEDKILDPDTIRRGVRSVFEDPSRGFYLVASRGDQPVACLMVTYEWSDWRNGQFWWIQSVYVRPEFRRQGLYRRLYDYLRTLAADEPGVCGFRLYAETDNAAAHATYRACGMEECAYRMFEELL